MAQSGMKSENLGIFKRTSDKNIGFEVNFNTMQILENAKHLRAACRNNPDRDYTKDAEALKGQLDNSGDEFTRRFCESVALVALGVSRNFLKPPDKEITKKLIGTTAFDGVVYDEAFKDPYRIEQSFKNGGDPSARDAPIFGNTIPHCMAMCGDCRWHTESWHIDRINSLRKRGCDNRCAPDIQGRAPLLVGFENYNVLFVKALLRSEMGETWSHKKLKRVPAYAPQGRLMKELLNSQKSSIGGGNRRGGRDNSLRDELRQLVETGKAKAIYRLGEGGWLSALHWAAYHNDPKAIYLLHLIGLPVNLSNCATESSIIAHKDKKGRTSAYSVFARVSEEQGQAQQYQDPRKTILGTLDPRKSTMTTAPHAPFGGGGGTGSPAGHLTPETQNEPGPQNTNTNPGSIVQVTEVNGNGINPPNSARDTEKFPGDSKIDYTIYTTIETPLLMAVSHNCPDAVSALLKCRADPHQENSMGQSAISLALQKENQEIVKILEKDYENEPISDKDVQSFGTGLSLGFDTVHAVADLIDGGIVEFPSIEDLCAWYINLGPSPYLRVLRFWEYYQSRKLDSRPLDKNMQKIPSGHSGGKIAAANFSPSVSAGLKAQQSGSGPDNSGPVTSGNLNKSKVPDFPAPKSKTANVNVDSPASGSESGPTGSKQMSQKVDSKVAAPTAVEIKVPSKGENSGSEEKKES